MEGEPLDWKKFEKHINQLDPYSNKYAIEPFKEIWLHWTFKGIEITAIFSGNNDIWLYFSKSP